MKVILISVFIIMIGMSSARKHLEVEAPSRPGMEPTKRLTSPRKVLDSMIDFQLFNSTWKVDMTPPAVTMGWETVQESTTLTNSKDAWQLRFKPYIETNVLLVNTFHINKLIT